MRLFRAAGQGRSGVSGFAHWIQHRWPEKVRSGHKVESVGRKRETPDRGALIFSLPQPPPWWSVRWGGVGLLQPLELSTFASPGSLAFWPACCSHRCLPLRNPLGPRSDPLLLPSPPSVTGAAWLCPLRRRLLPAFVPPSLACSLPSPPPPYSSPPSRQHSGSCSPAERGPAPPANPTGLHFPSSPATGTHSTRLRSHTQTHTHTALPLTLSLAAAAASVWLCLSSALLSPPFFLSVPRVRPPPPPRERRRRSVAIRGGGGIRSGQY